MAARWAPWLHMKNLMEKILHQLICSLSHYLQGFIHPRWVFGIFSINSIPWSLFYPKKQVKLDKNISLPVDQYHGPQDESYNLWPHPSLGLLDGHFWGGSQYGGARCTCGNFGEWSKEWWHHGMTPWQRQIFDRNTLPFEQSIARVFLHFVFKSVLQVSREFMKEKRTYSKILGHMFILL